jgi:hypothetical protein
VTAIDHRTDIYSAGVVLYEMLCGRTPFFGRSYPEVLGQILEGKYRKPSELRPDIPPEVESAIARALARDIEARFPTAAAMRSALSAGHSEITLAPVPIPAPEQAEAAGFPALGPALDAPIPLAEPTPAVRASAKRATAPGADPFAPPPDAEAAPLLAGTMDRSVAYRPSPARPAPPEVIDRDEAIPVPRARATAVREPPASVRRAPTVAPREQVVIEPEGPSRSRRPWLPIAIVAVVVAIGVPIAYSRFGGDGHAPLLPRLTSKPKIALRVDPKEASVQIDHVPVTSPEVALDAGEGRSHTLNAAAPGRITRRFVFSAKPGMKLVVHLGRVLEAPAATDPAPLAAELAVDYPESPRPGEEIDAAFAKLARYGDCFGLDGGNDGESKKGRPAARDEALGPCRLAVTEGGESEPAFPELQTAAESYLTLVQKGQKPDLVARAAAAFRAEFLAARAAWQVEELSRHEKDEGQNAAWHMRRVALAGQAWLRSRMGGSTETIEQKRAALDQAVASFMSFVRSTPKALTQTTGATDFVAAAEAAVALADGAGGRKATSIAALEACRKLVASFNALVVE